MPSVLFWKQKGGGTSAAGVRSEAPQPLTSTRESRHRRRRGGGMWGGMWGGGVPLPTGGVVWGGGCTPSPEKLFIFRAQNR